MNYGLELNTINTDNISAKQYASQLGNREDIINFIEANTSN